MELSYMPDSIARFSYNPWNYYSQCDERNFNVYSSKKHHPNLQEIKFDEKTCRICREKKKKNFCHYAKNGRRRDCRISTTIREEEKEEEEEEEEKEDKEEVEEVEKVNEVSSSLEKIQISEKEIPPKN